MLTDTTADVAPGTGVLGYPAEAAANGLDAIKRFEDGWFNAKAPVKGCAEAIVRSTVLRKSHSYYPVDYRVWGNSLLSLIYPDYWKRSLRPYRLNKDS